MYVVCEYVCFCEQFKSKPLVKQSYLMVLQWHVKITSLQNIMKAHLDATVPRPVSKYYIFFSHLLIQTISHYMCFSNSIQLCIMR